MSGVRFFARSIADMLVDAQQPLLPTTR